MKFAIAVSGSNVSGPGEADEILVYDLNGSSELLENYQNPGLSAVSARGIAMLKSVIDRGVEKLIISGIGEHAMQYASGKIELLNGAGLSIDVVLTRISKNELQPIKSASHRGGEHHRHS